MYIIVLPDIVTTSDATRQKQFISAQFYRLRALNIPSTGPWDSARRLKKMKFETFVKRKRVYSENEYVM